MTLFAILFALTIILTLGSGVWLVLHLTSLASLFAGKADIVPSSKRPNAPRRRVIMMIALFLTGLAGTLALQFFSIAVSN